MLLSLIVPVYNTSEYLPKCLKSLEILRYEDDIEIIFINDGSTDDSEVLLTRFSKGYQNIIVFNKSNEGQSVARNIGIEVATGEYIGFIDSDDYIIGDYFLKIIEKLKTQTLDLVVFGYNKVSKSGEVLNQCTNHNVHIQTRAQLLDAFLQIQPYETIGGFSCNKILRRSIIGDRRYEIMNFEDLPFIVECMTKVNTTLYVNLAVYNYVERSGSIVHIFNDNYLEDKQKALDMVVSLLNTTKVSKQKLSAYRIINEINMYYVSILISSDYEHEYLKSIKNYSLKKIMQNSFISSKDIFKIIIIKLRLYPIILKLKR